MSLNKDMQSLIDSIRKPILFFLPNDLVEDKSEEVKQKLEDIGLIKQLLFLNKDNKASYYKEGLDDYAIMEKQKLLKSNIFQLLEFQSKLDNKSFHFLMNNYSEEVKAWQWSSEWLSDNAKHHVNGYSKVMQSALEIQKRTFKEHQLELISSFNKVLKNTNEKEIVPAYKLNIYQDKISNLNITNNETIKKKVLLTDVVADTYLLQTVFNIEL